MVGHYAHNHTPRRARRTSHFSPEILLSDNRTSPVFGFIATI